MNRENLLRYFRTTLTILGAVLTAFCLVSLPAQAFSWGFLFLVFFSIVISPRISLAIPHLNLGITFSDALTFLAFLFYGTEAAIVLSALEMAANCYYSKWSGTLKFDKGMIAVNVWTSAISMAAACVVWMRVAQATEIEFFAGNTRNLISSIGVLAITQFLATTVLMALFRTLKYGQSFWTTWKKDYFSSSMTQIVGAGIAGIIYKIINYGDPMTAGVAMALFGMVYLTYRQSLSEVNSAIAQVEDAEKEKAETERERRREAEKHAGQLKRSLDKEERANEALRKSERDLQHAALHDSLTGLANRKKLGDMLRILIEAYKDDPSNNFQVLFLDIRSFKNINDTLGHSVGDKVLTIAAKRFVRCVNHGDVVARIGGDEFAIILRNLSTVGKAQKVARRIYQNVTQPFSLGGNMITIDVNIGIASCDAEYDTPEEILRDADIAMHAAKEKSEGPAVFTKELRSRFLERVRFEMDLRYAIDRGELSLNYQPIVSLSDGELMGFEALLRWHHSEFGMIPPNKFIPIAEQSGLIQPITVWILGEACRQFVHWQKISPEYKEMMVSINISGRHLTNNDLIDDVQNALQASGLQARCLKLEITESTAMENAEHTINILNQLKLIGVQLSIDDFGTGYSSLSYLQRLPFDTLKIDRSFVSSIGETGENSEIVQTIISLAKNLRMRVIAEGIETRGQLAVLANLGCDFGQGYLLSKPKTREDAENLLYERPNLLPDGQPTTFESTDDTAVDERLPVF
jgi:diguanylate cyclase (GGDEF)-like protein